MRLTLWQQFSSNHSGGFTVVGSFKSSDAAASAATTLQDILTRIGHWYKEDPQNRGGGTTSDPPSPPEQEVIQHYHLESKQAFGLTEDVRASLSISTDDNWLFIYVGEVWWDPGHLVLNQLVERLGADHVSMQNWVDAGYLSLIEIRLSCPAADEATAEKIYRETEQYLQLPLLLDDVPEDDPVSELAPWLGIHEFARQANGTIQRDGLELAFVLRLNSGHGLPRLMQSLQAHGCANFRYSLAEVDATPDELETWL